MGPGLHWRGSFSRLIHRGMVTKAGENDCIFPENKERPVKQKEMMRVRGMVTPSALTCSLYFVLKWCSWPHKYAQSFGCQIKMKNRKSGEKLSLSRHIKEPGVVADIYNPSTRESETGR